MPESTTEATNERRYFFSYVRQDGDFVLKLATEIRKAGAKLWVDQLDIVGGQRWDQAVEAALKNCEGMIVVLSPESVASDNVMDEVSYALEQRKLVVPVLYRACSFPFRLRRVQFVDFTQDFGAGCAQLLRALGIPQSSRGDVVPLPGPAPSAREIPTVRVETPESAGRLVPAAEGTPHHTPEPKWNWRPLVMHLVVGIGLLVFNSALLRGWLYPVAFLYSTFVGSACFGSVRLFQPFCQGSFSFFSFLFGIGLYLAGFVDVAFGVYYRAKGRRLSFWN